MKCVKYGKELLLGGGAVGWGRRNHLSNHKVACSSKTEPMHQLLSPSLRSQQQPQRGSGAKLGSHVLLPGKWGLKSHMVTDAVVPTSCNHLGLAPRRTKGPRWVADRMPRRGHLCKGESKAHRPWLGGQPRPSSAERSQAGCTSTSAVGTNNFHWAALGFCF